MLNFLNIPTTSDDTIVKFFLVSDDTSTGIKQLMILWKETKNMWW